jgi:DNA processing protein
MSALGPHPDALARLALASLPAMGPARGRWLLGGGAPPAEVVGRLAQGRLPAGLGPPPPKVTAEVLAGWGRALQRIDPLERWRAHQAAGVRLLTPEGPVWPFAGDPDPPLVCWSRGRVELLGQEPAVAVVGTRRCSAIGARVARQLGRELAEAGVVVISGLAAGIDAAAHAGALAASDAVVGVVGTGPDVVYPPSSAQLREQVGRRGVLVGEALLGARGERWRFPARNRLVAALSAAVVVVESHRSGGALHTVTEAERRQVPVLAVPGSVLSPASAGTNHLLFDGAGMARGAADVLTALGLTYREGHGGREQSPDVGAEAAELLAGLAAGPVRLDDLLADRPVAEVAALLHRLATSGLVVVTGGEVSLGSA